MSDHYSSDPDEDEYEKNLRELRQLREMAHTSCLRNLGLGIPGRGLTPEDHEWLRKLGCKWEGRDGHQ